MKRHIVMPALVALALLAAAIPAQASAWRSSTGNIFRFQPNGYYTVLYANGGSLSGSWWWVCNGSEFAYQPGGKNYTRHVYIHGNSATNTDYYGGNATYWTWLGNRGAKSEAPPIKGWFMDAHSTPMNSK